MEAHLAAWWWMKRLPACVVLGGLGTLAEEVGQEVRGKEARAGERAWQVMRGGGRRARVIG
jgi:hypothetical protein